jgi:biofilm PGA synthesis N-glycosyltransferase PgaC
MKYYVITPAKNEEKYISFTLDSMIQQKIKPIQWIIVDDGSTDRTIEIVEKYQKDHLWITLISLNTKEEKKLYGSKVIKAFNAGYDLIKNAEYDFVVKLDADISFPDYYFEEIGKSFANNKKLGICGGYLCESEQDFSKVASQSTYVQGPAKSITANCFREIGGFLQENGWDGLDQLKAMYLGWEVANIPIQIIHHRKQTTEYRSLNFFYNNGITHYRSGNDFILTFIRTLVKLKEKPYFMASYNYFKGYLYAFLSRQPKLVDEKLARFIRSYHYKRLLSFKR